MLERKADLRQDRQALTATAQDRHQPRTGTAQDLGPKGFDPQYGAGWSTPTAPFCRWFRLRARRWGGPPPLQRANRLKSFDFPGRGG
jgi:hypothetical protein